MNFVEMENKNGMTELNNSDNMRNCQQSCAILEKEDNNISKKKMWIYILSGGVAFILLLIVLSIGSGKGVNKVLLASERAETEEGNLIYEIKYTYNEYGEEVSRVAYDAYGNEDDRYLKYAGDLQPFLQDYWRVDIDEETKGSKYFIFEEDYGYTYNPQGYLTCCDFFKDNDLNIYAVYYEYRSIKVKDNTDRQEKVARQENVARQEDIDGDEIIDRQDNEEASFDTKGYSLKDKLMDDVGIINAGGEECYALWGETGAIIWKYVDATFEEEGYVASSFAFDIADTISTSDEHDQSELGWDAMRLFNWHKWVGWKEFTPIHIGDDIFLFEGYSQEYATSFSYYIDAINHRTAQTKISFYDEDDMFTRITNFNDGYAIGEYGDHHDSNWGWWSHHLSLINNHFEVIISDIDVSSSGNNIYGEYSDGVFFCNGVFYDIDFNPVLDISRNEWGNIYNNQSVYSPCFRNGVCTLITYKNDKYWIFDIDKSGNVLTEIKEFDLNELNY